MTFWLYISIKYPSIEFEIHDSKRKKLNLHTSGLAYANNASIPIETKYRVCVCVDECYHDLTNDQRMAV